MPAVAFQTTDLRVDSHRTLTRAQLQDYAADGFLILRRLFDADNIAELDAECERLLTRTDLMSPDNLRCRFQPHVVTGEKQFEVFDPVNDISPVCTRIARDERLLDVMTAIYGEPACPFKDKLIFKPPRTKGYDLHQDFPPNWPGFPTSFVTVLIPIDEATADNGCTELFSGYHRNGSLVSGPEASCMLPSGLVDDSRGVKLIMQPGDVAIFGCFTPHRSAPNHTDGWRRSLFLSYSARSDGGEQHDKHYSEFHAWIRHRYPEPERSKLYFQ